MSERAGQSEGGGGHAERREERRENHRKMFKESYRSNTDTERIAYKNIDSETLGSMLKGRERERKTERTDSSLMRLAAFIAIYRSTKKKKTPRFPIFYL